MTEERLTELEVWAKYLPEMELDPSWAAVHNAHFGAESVLELVAEVRRLRTVLDDAEQSGMDRNLED